MKDPSRSGVLHPGNACSREHRGSGLRLAPWLLLAALLYAAAPGAGHAHADPVVSTTATVSSSGGLNLRSGPGTGYAVVTLIPDGSAVTVTGSGTPDNWLPVQYAGQLGWVSGEFVGLHAGTLAPDTPAAPVSTAASTAVVAPADGVNLRSGPGVSESVLAVLPGGTNVSITGSAQNNFDPVTANGMSGWVNADYLLNFTSPAITANAVSGSGGATLNAPAGTGSAPRTAPDSASAGGGTKFAWPVDSRRISTVFSAAHPGIDIDQAPSGGTPVRASATGTVSFAGGNKCCSYGLYVIVDHGGGYQTLYGHFSTIGVKQGDTVTVGQQLGLSGCTGVCTGPHVHFEVRVNGERVDPLRFLPPPWTIV